MAALLSVTVPVPSTVSVPAPLPMTPDTVMLPAPPKVRLFAPFVMPPESVRVPESELMRVFPVRVTAPAKLLFPLMLRKAPVLEIPSPFREIALAPTAMPPLARRAAPVLTETDPVLLPSAAAFCISR